MLGDLEKDNRSGPTSGCKGFPLSSTQPRCPTYCSVAKVERKELGSCRLGSTVKCFNHNRLVERSMAANDGAKAAIVCVLKRRNDAIVCIILSSAARRSHIYTDR